MSQTGSKRKKWLFFTLRWGIAVAGITYVLWNIRFHDRVRILDAQNRPDEVRVLNSAKDGDLAFTILDPQTGQQVVVPREKLWTLPDAKSVEIATPQGTQKAKLLAVRPAGVDGEAARTPAELLIEDPQTQQPRAIDPAAVASKQKPTVSYPLVEIGINRMVAEADWMFLLAAVLVLPIIYLLTSYRWHLLLDALQIRIGMARTFVINMVGAFYNSFMPGSTGGDLVKAYYASKHTEHRTRAILSVVVDRIIGLLALLVVGGTMAAAQFHIPECRKVAIFAGSVILCTVIGLFVFYHPRLRRGTGLDWLLKRLPMQKQVHTAVHAMEAYGRRPRTVAWAFLCSFPVHFTTILSATLAGMAFHLDLPPGYYWVIVPVIALVGAIPISPQGAGVMEFFAVQLTIHRGVTVAQAVALVMSIRLTQIFWNLVCGLFVLRGGYHAPTEKEAHELEEEEEDDLADVGDAPATPASTSGTEPVRISSAASA